MSNQQELFELLKHHLEFKDNWGNNPYMPKEKADALLKELQSFTAKVYEQGKLYGTKEGVVGLITNFQKAVEKQKDDAKITGDEWNSIRSFLEWRDKL